MCYACLPYLHFPPPRPRSAIEMQLMLNVHLVLIMFHSCRSTPLRVSSTHSSKRSNPAFLVSQRLWTVLASRNTTKSEKSLTSVSCLTSALASTYTQEMPILASSDRCDAAISSGEQALVLQPWSDPSQSGPLTRWLWDDINLYDNRGRFVGQLFFSFWRCARNVSLLYDGL